MDVPDGRPSSRGSKEERDGFLNYFDDPADFQLLIEFLQRKTKGTKFSGFGKRVKGVRLKELRERISHGETFGIFRILVPILEKAGLGSGPQDLNDYARWVMERGEQARELVLRESFAWSVGVSTASSEEKDKGADASLKKGFTSYFDDEELKVLLYIAAYHPDAEKFFLERNIRQYRDLIVASEKKKTGVEMLKFVFPSLEIMTFLGSKLGLKSGAGDVEKLVAVTREALPKLRDEAVENANVERATGRTDSLEGVVADWVASKKDPAKPLQVKRRSYLLHAREESAKGISELYTEFFGKILDYASKTLTIDNRQIGNVAVSEHAWQRFIERYLQVKGPPNLSIEHPDFEDYAKKLNSAFRRAQVVTLPPKIAKRKLKKYRDEPSVYLQDQHTNLMFVVADQKVKVLTTTYIFKMD